MTRCECGKYCEGATRVLHRADRSGVAAVVDEVMMAYENCPNDDAAALRSIEARIDDGTAKPEVAEWFDVSEASHFLHPDR